MATGLRHLARLAVVLSLSPSTAAIAQQVVDSYVAVIGPQDRFNSSGAALTQPGQILAQDRANFHRFGIRQDGDTADRTFLTTEKRARIPALLGSGSVDPAVARAILGGQDAPVLVEVLGSAGRATGLRVTLVTGAQQQPALPGMSAPQPSDLTWNFGRYSADMAFIASADLYRGQDLLVSLRCVEANGAQPAAVAGIDPTPGIVTLHLAPQMAGSGAAGQAINAELALGPSDTLALPFEWRAPPGAFSADLVLVPGFAERLAEGRVAIRTGAQAVDFAGSSGLGEAMAQLSQACMSQATVAAKGCADLEAGADLAQCILPGRASGSGQLPDFELPQPEDGQPQASTAPVPDATASAVGGSFEEVVPLREEALERRFALWMLSERPTMLENEIGWRRWASSDRSFGRRDDRESVSERLREEARAAGAPRRLIIDLPARVPDGDAPMGGASRPPTVVVAEKTEYGGTAGGPAETLRQLEFDNGFVNGSVVLSLVNPVSLVLEGQGAAEAAARGPAARHFLRLEIALEDPVIRLPEVDPVQPRHMGVAATADARVLAASLIDDAAPSRGYPAEPGEPFYHFSSSALEAGMGTEGAPLGDAAALTSLYADLTLRDDRATHGLRSLYPDPDALVEAESGRLGAEQARLAMSLVFLRKHGPDRDIDPPVLRAIADQILSPDEWMRLIPTELRRETGLNVNDEALAAHLASIEDELLEAAASVAPEWPVAFAAVVPVMIRRYDADLGGVRLTVGQTPMPWLRRQDAIERLLEKDPRVAPMSAAEAEGLLASLDQRTTPARRQIAMRVTYDIVGVDAPFVYNLAGAPGGPPGPITLEVIATMGGLVEVGAAELFLDEKLDEPLARLPISE
ncbi:hypothetical protein AB4874_17245 [Thioclava sp. 15-R06ZXC-3]|uniref:Uncharacterized protein n=1 Tax=Thioclava arctica TaxID=3238301 RepID=A0ABV3TQ60_9RHOB